jgi:hypothetical protein
LKTVLPWWLLLPTIIPVALTGQDRPLDLSFLVEWRLIDAGRATLKWTPTEARGGKALVGLESQGLVSKLLPIRNEYTTNLDERGCTVSTFLHAREGDRKRETTVAFDRAGKKANYQERDLVKNTVANRQTEIPACTFDVIGALIELRRLKLEPGTTLNIPVSDGKKFVNARVEVQGRERVKTPAGEFDAIRCEAFLFDGVLYARKARLHIWFTDDATKVPVQIRIAMRFYIGTVTLQLDRSR